MSDLRNYYRLVGGLNDGKRTPIWMWEGGRNEWRIPVCQKPEIYVWTEEDPSPEEGRPDYEVFRFRVVPITEDLDMGCWVRDDLSDRQVRHRVVGVLLDEDAP